MGKASRRKRQQVVRPAAARADRRVSADVLPAVDGRARVLAELGARTRTIAADIIARDALVADARAAGCSWSEIAGALGVTQQAAHKRFRSQL